MESPGRWHSEDDMNLGKVSIIDTGMNRWGSEGEELSLRYWLIGYQCSI